MQGGGNGKEEVGGSRTAGWNWGERGGEGKIRRGLWTWGQKVGRRGVRQSEAANKGGGGEGDAAGKTVWGGACRGVPTTPDRPEESAAVADSDDPWYLDLGPRMWWALAELKGRGSRAAPAPLGKHLR